MSLPFEPISIRAIEGFGIGNATLAKGGSGCTVIVAPRGAVGGVDVRGGAPASRETDLLKPENTVQEVHAVCLSGGSAYGLEAASGVARELETHGIGLDVGVGIVPIVCSSCLFDLGFGDPYVRPGIEEGRSATREALASLSENREMPSTPKIAGTSRTGAPIDPDLQGNVGAGTGATVGKLNGFDRAMKGGLGTAALQLGTLKVGAIAAVNACGNVYDPQSQACISGMRVSRDGLDIVSMEKELLAQGTQATMPLDRTNTTISCLITNARLTKAQATKVSQMAADAYAHTIRPTHTTNDGDTVYTLSHGTEEAPLDLIGLLATRALEQAIANGCRYAESAHNIPGHASI